MCLFCRFASINFACLTRRATLVEIWGIVLRLPTSDHRTAIFHLFGRISRLRLAEQVGQHA